MKPSSFLLLIYLALLGYNPTLWAGDWELTLAELEVEEPLLAELIKSEYPHYQNYLESLESGNFSEQFGREFGESLSIVGASTVAAVLYGISMDMITAHLSIEYFSTGFHDYNLQVQNPSLNEFLREAQVPSLYALVWGPIASWWVGLPLGLPLAWAARTDLDAPQYTWKDLVPKLAMTMGATLGVSLASGLNYYLKNPDQFDLDRRYDTALSIHQSAYLFGSLFGLGCAVWIFIERDQEGKRIDKERELFLNQLLTMQAEGLVNQRENFEKFVLSTLE